jgi:hypothetical protein
LQPLRKIHREQQARLAEKWENLRLYCGALSRIVRMRLESMRVHGLRRFGGETPHKLRLDGKLICIIGANEVGKSTLLDALAMVRADERRDVDDDVIPVDSLLLTRGEEINDDRTLVSVRYRLEDDDLARLAELPGAKQVADVRWLQRSLRASGEIVHDLDPVPERDKGPRWSLARVLATVTRSAAWIAEEEAVGTPADPRAMEAMITGLSSRASYLPQAVRDQLTALAGWIEDDEDVLTEWLAGSQDQASLPQTIRETLDVEAIPHPLHQAIDALVPRSPSSSDSTETSVASATSMTSQIPKSQSHCATSLPSLALTFRGCTTRLSPVRPAPLPTSSTTPIGV